MRAGEDRLAALRAREKAKLDLGIFSAIMSHWNIKDIDANAIAEKFGTSQQKVAGMVYAAKNTPRAYLELVRANASPGQIPPWIMRPGEDAPPSPPEKPPSSPEAPSSTPSTSLNLENNEENPPLEDKDYTSLKKDAGTNEIGGIPPYLDAPSSNLGSRLGARALISFSQDGRR